MGPYVIEDADFLAWYERWLYEAVAGYDIGWSRKRKDGRALANAEPIADEIARYARSCTPPGLDALATLFKVTLAGVLTEPAADDLERRRRAAYRLTELARGLASPTWSPGCANWRRRSTAWAECAPAPVNRNTAMERYRCLEYEPRVPFPGAGAVGH